MKNTRGMTVLFTVVALFFSLCAVFSPIAAVCLVVLMAFCLFIYFNPLLGVAVISAASLLDSVINILLYKFRISFPACIIVPTYIILLPKMVNEIKYTDKFVKNFLAVSFFFIGWALLSILWSHDAENLLYLVSSLLLSQIFILSIKDEKALYRLFIIYILLGIVCGAILVRSKWYFSGGNILDLPDLNISWIFFHEPLRPGGFIPGSAATLIMNTFVFVAVAMLYGSNVPGRIFCGLSVMFFLVCVGMNNSKIGILSLLIGSAFFVFAPTFRHYRIRIASLITMLICFLLAVAGQDFYTRIVVMMEKPLDAQKNYSRLTWWKEGIERFLDTYGIGVGTGGLRDYLNTIPITNVASLYFSTLFDLGIVGVSLLVIILILIARYVIKTLRTCGDEKMVFLIYCLTASLITLGLHAATEGDYATIFFWLYLSLVITALKVINKQNEFKEVF